MTEKEELTQKDMKTKKFIETYYHRALHYSHELYIMATKLSDMMSLINASEYEIDEIDEEAAYVLIFMCELQAVIPGVYKNSKEQIKEYHKHAEKDDVKSRTNSEKRTARDSVN